jgi:hypothetical protein
MVEHKGVPILKKQCRTPNFTQDWIFLGIFCSLVFLEFFLEFFLDFLEFPEKKFCENVYNFSKHKTRFQII